MPRPSQTLSDEQRKFLEQYVTEWKEKQSTKRGTKELGDIVWNAFQNQWKDASTPKTRTAIIQWFYNKTRPKNRPAVAASPVAADHSLIVPAQETQTKEVMVAAEDTDWVDNPGIVGQLPQDALLQAALPNDALPNDAPPKAVLPNNAPPKAGLRNDAPPKAVLLNDAPPKAALSNDAPPGAALRNDAPPKAVLPNDAPPKAALRNDAPPKAVLPNDAPPKAALRNDAPPKAVLPNDAPPKAALRNDALLKAALPNDADLKAALPKATLVKAALPKDALEPYDVIHQSSSKHTLAATKEASQQPSVDHMSPVDSVQELITTMEQLNMLSDENVTVHTIESWNNAKVEIKVIRPSSLMLNGMEKGKGKVKCTRCACRFRNQTDRNSHDRQIHCERCTIHYHGTTYHLVRGAIIPGAFLCPCGAMASIDTNVITSHTRKEHALGDPLAKMVPHSATPFDPLLKSKKGTVAQKKSTPVSIVTPPPNLTISEGLAPVGSTSKGSALVTFVQDFNQGPQDTLPPTPIQRDPITGRVEASPLLLIIDKTTFQWSDGRHKCLHGKQEAPAEHSTVDGTCAALSYFSGMFYSPALNLIISPRYRTSVPFSTLDDFLGAKEKSALKSLSQSQDVTLSLLLEHFSAVFQIDPKQTLETATQALSLVELSHPVPTLGAPLQAFQCSGCLGWYNCSRYRPIKGIEHHWRDSNPFSCRTPPPPEKRRNPRCQWTLPLITGKQTLSKRVAIVSSWKPESPASAYSNGEVSVIKYSAPEWITTLGWQDYIKSLDAKPSALRQLISLPSKQIVDSWPEGSDGWLIESGLCTIHNFMRSYLLDADYLVSISHPSLRSIITMGTKAKFRPLQYSTLTAYRSIATQTIVMMVRYMLWMNFSRVKHLGNFKPIVTSTQAHIVGDIYRFLISNNSSPALLSGNGDDTNILLGGLVHQLMVTILKTTASVQTRVGLPVEQVLLFNMLHPDGEYRRANLLTELSARTQRLLFSIFVHSGFLGGFDCDYVAIQKEETNHQEVSQDDESDEESDKESEVEAELEEMFEEMEFGLPSEGTVGDALEGDNISQQYSITPHCLQLLRPVDGDIMDFHGEEEEDDEDEEDDEEYHPSVEGKQLSVTHNDDGEPDPILKFLNDDANRIYILPTSSVRSTLASRVKTIWMIAHPVAIREPSAVRLDWQAGGQSFNFKFGRMNRVISLAKLRLAICDEVQRLKTTLQDLLPTDFDLSSFSLDLVHDSPDDRTSLFDREDNKRVFNGFIKNLWDKLGRGSGTLMGKDCVVTRENRLRPTVATRFLHKCEELQKCLIRSIFTTIGICPRPWQAGEFTYRPVGDYPRNLRMMKNLFVLIGEPRAKQRDALASDAFWALPPQLGLVIVFYLGIVRPVEIDLMKQLFIPTSEAESYIFVHTRAPPQPGHTTQHWNGTAVNKALTSAEEPMLAMEGRAWRHILCSIIEYHFAPLLQSTTMPKLKSLAMNDQAQHTQGVGDVHYAVDEFSRAVGMTKSSRNQQFALSQSYQAFLGLIPEDFQWSQYSTKEVRPAAERRKNQILALGLARTLLLQKGDYDIASGLQDQRVRKVEEIFCLQPFLRGTWDPNAPWVALGDDLLISVSATLYYGDTQPSLTSFAPPEGYPISTAVEGSALIIIALEEWRTGSFQPIHSTESSVRHLASAGLIGILEDFKIKRPRAWHQFCSRVHDFAAHKGRNDFFMKSESFSRFLLHPLVPPQSDEDEEEE